MRASSPEPDSFATLVDVLRFRADQQKDALLYRFLETGDVEGPSQEWTFGHLDQLARGIGALLQEAGAKGERALLLFPPGLEFVSAFMGCLYAGVVAVPVYPPDPSRLDRRLERVGIHDSVFDLGGHSLQMVQVHHRLKADHPELQLVKLLEHPTIASLATWLSEAPSARVSIESAQDRARRQVEVLRRQRQRATRKE